jgi:hypothetical protein
MRTRRSQLQRTACAFFVSTLFVLLHATNAFAQLDQWGYWENGVSESWWFSSNEFDSADAVNAVERWKSIGAELKDAKGDAAWAGDFFLGSDTHGSYMRWSPQSGFIIAHVNKCEARITGLIYGSRVEVSPTLVQFFPEFSKDSKHGHGKTHDAAQTHDGAQMLAPLRFVPVRWRGERLLVEESEMGDFGDYIAGLGKYNHWDFLYVDITEFYTKFGGAVDANEKPSEASTEAKEKADASPIVPQGYGHFLKKPIETTIVGVGQKRVKQNYSYENPDGSGMSYTEPVSLTFVTVKAGANDGVKLGMMFRVVDPEGGEQVRIVRVGKAASTGVIVRNLDKGGREAFPDGESNESVSYVKVAAGWRLTTSPF